jgi:hypothetical protein
VSCLLWMGYALTFLPSRTFAKSFCHTFLLPYRVCVSHAHSCTSPLPQTPIRCGKAALLSQCLTVMLKSHFNVPVFLKTVTFFVSETSVNFCLNIRRHKPEDGRSRNKKSGGLICCECTTGYPLDA